ncbi:MAG: hypothetical protein MJB14_07550 [Spirochaetes bacterium]|nr:hypothetical protein [Spirochaetota bacterium]
MKKTIPLLLGLIIYLIIAPMIKIPFFTSLMIVVIGIIALIVLGIMGISKSPKVNQGMQNMEDQQIISRLRSFLFRIQDDTIRRQGEVITDNLRQVISIQTKAAQSEQAELQLEYRALMDYVKQANEIIEKYINLKQLDNDEAKDFQQRIHTLFNQIQQETTKYTDKFKKADIKDLSSELTKLEKNLELNQYLNNPNGDADRVLEE